MKASVTIPVNELKRLFLSSIKSGVFNKRVISDITYRLLDRIEKDYPEMLKPLHQTVYKKYQEQLARELKLQREMNRRSIENIYGGQQ